MKNAHEILITALARIFCFYDFPSAPAHAVGFEGMSKHVTDFLGDFVRVPGGEQQPRLAFRNDGWKPAYARSDDWFSRGEALQRHGREILVPLRRNNREECAAEQFRFSSARQESNQFDVVESFVANVPLQFCLQRTGPRNF